MITVHAYEDVFGYVHKMISHNDEDTKRIEAMAYELHWGLLHIYPIEAAARFR